MHPMQFNESFDCMDKNKTLKNLKQSMEEIEHHMRGSKITQLLDIEKDS